MYKSGVIFLFLMSFLLAGCSLPNIFSSKKASLQIDTSPKSVVYLNGEKVGETPFSNQELNSEEYSVRLVPEEDGFIEWESTTKLYAGITTVITYDFAKDRQAASGSILTLEPIQNKEAVEIAVISIPDNTSVKLDGQPKGFSPLQIKNIEEGEHTIVISSPGYKQEQLEVKTVKGYKLTIDIQLAKETLKIASEGAQPAIESKKQENISIEKEKSSQENTASISAEIRKPYVEILDTPTGWLRVRSEPSTVSGEEVAKVNPGEKYPYLETNESGWHQIKLSNGISGWISGRYAKLVK
jgi:hypothetical protein